ncbi:MAG: translation initiation factor IF-2 subunit gamma, partial [Candidatus Micrarchaeales archaeon]
KRNMTIKLGYADVVIKKCPNHKGAEAYTTKDKCDDGTKAEPFMRISLIDAPGHETLMATAIAGSNIIDGILFVIAANEPCPMPQTKEHLMIINVLGIKNVIIIQSKVDIVGKEGAKKHFKQIKDFIKGSTIENAPIIPVMTNQGINIDVVLEMIANMKRPERELTASPMMYVVRSFDVNKPGADATKITGGVIGGAIIKGKFKVGDEIEIRPGMKTPGKAGKRETYVPIITTIDRMNTGSDDIKEAMPGGLIGISTEIDPAFTKADGLVGDVVGHVGKLPETVSEFTFKYHKLDRSDIADQSLKENEPLVMGIGTATAIGYVKKVKRDMVEVELKRPIAPDKNMKMAVMRNLDKRWRLTGYGIIS